VENWVEKKTTLCREQRYEEAGEHESIKATFGIVAVMFVNV